MRCPYLPVQRPRAATRSPPPLRRRCTPLLLSCPIPARTVTKTASAHPKPPRARTERAERGRGGPPTSRGGVAPDPAGSVATRGPAGSIGEAGNDGRRARAEALGEPDAGSGIRAPHRVFERGGAERSGERGEGREETRRSCAVLKWTNARWLRWGRGEKFGFLQL
jgi:hypothetical protein